ncbi:Hypothetical protein A7982_09130 [Minicystis rosea]|nr:Hypothetical protein A7982_09130 [Minicystis rosea]
MAATSAPAASSASTSLDGLLEGRASASEIEAYLDGLAPAARLEEVLAVTGRGVKRLYEAVEGSSPPSLEELVPTGTEGVLIYEGRNSLAAFSRFQKRFVRKGGLVLGYNHQSMSFVTGPGYFVVHPPSGSGEHGKELDFDYTTPPPAEPAGWPAYKPNERGLSRFVYGHMHDYVRRVARGVVVGKAYRHGKEQDAYFSLTLPR